MFADRVQVASVALVQTFREGTPAWVVANHHPGTAGVLL